MNNTFINALIKDNMLQLNKKGFTLIELLVVIAIIGVLGSIVFAPFNEARKKGRDGKRMAELKALQSSLLLFSEDHSGCYPDAAAASTSASYFAKASNRYVSSVMFSKVANGNANATYSNAANNWTTTKPYVLRSVGDDSQCLRTLSDSVPYFPTYQLYVELETHTTALDGDADNSTTISGKVNNAAKSEYDSVNFSATTFENCASNGYAPGNGTNPSSYQCVYDLSNL